MKRSGKEWVLRIIILMIGLTIAHFGVTLFLLSELGSDPFNVLIQGLFRTLSGSADSSFLTHGRVHIAVCLLIIVVLLIVRRIIPSISSLTLSGASVLELWPAPAIHSRGMPVFLCHALLYRMQEPARMIW